MQSKKNNIYKVNQTKNDECTAVEKKFSNESLHFSEMYILNTFEMSVACKIALINGKNPGKLVCDERRKRRKDWRRV